MKWIRGPVVLLLGLALTLVPPQVVFGQSTQQQEEQRRQEQEREQQQRDQQQREEQQRQQQERDRQQHEEQQRQQQERDQQQREEQQRQQQERDQQQREEQQRQQQERDRQQREEQQRQQQERDQQQREEQQRQQERDRQQREEQQQQQQQQQQLSTSSSSSSTAPSNVNSSVVSESPAAGHANHGAAASGSTIPPATPHVAAQQPDIKNSVPQKQFPELDRKTNPVQRENTKISKDHESATHETNLQVRKCSNGSCTEPEPKPVPPAKCKTGSCAKCPAGQSPGKDNSCVVAPAQGAAAKNAPTAPQACPAGQVWNGVQCAFIGAQQCLPGQIATGGSCRADCTLATAGAQNYIVLLRNARQEKDDACLRNPTGQQCQNAEMNYNIRLNEYQAFLGPVPTECGLPNPFAI